jgi:LPS O-antigen subunit length determinant protein (WzzB/FepE family)
VPADEVPTLARGVRYFQDNVFSLAQDRRAGTITVSVEWTDRDTAAKWVNGIIDLANQEMRARAINQSQRTLNYMRTEAGKTSILEVQASLYRLMESELKKISLASSRREFALRVIDPATVPDRDDFVSPNRPLLIAGLCIFGGIIGLLVSMIVLSMRASHRAPRAGLPGAAA